MIPKYLHTYIIFVTLLKLGLAQELLFTRFMPKVQYRFQHQRPNGIQYGFVPLYLIKGPDPMYENAGDVFEPRRIFKRIRDRVYRAKRQVNEKEKEHFNDLLDSFGGMPDAEVAEGTSIATEKPKSGFYYLLDVNKFFEIDDQNGRRVNIRIQPKFGNPKRFFSISVP